jgi:hypothetical protein
MIPPVEATMSVLNITPPDRMTDRRGRPYFLWDSEMTLDQFRAALRHEDPEVGAYFLGKLMRQARPDDVFLFASVAEIRSLWPGVRRYLGRSKAFWTWLLQAWEDQRRDSR